jgi:hypothetical protein
MNMDMGNILSRCLECPKEVREVCFQYGPMCSTVYDRMED